MCREVNLKQAVTFGMKTQPPEGTLQEGGGEITTSFTVLSSSGRLPELLIG